VLRRKKRAIAAVAAAALGAWVLGTYLLLPDAAPLGSENPKETALMRQRALQAQEKGKPVRRRQHWVPLRQVAPIALKAIIASEDTAFYSHSGIDTGELMKVLAESWEKKRLVRGASTITQQLAKNLWLSTDRSLLRKLKELVLAKRLERALGKQRILELYVNVAEWGDGIYGIDSASREYFGLSAQELTPAQGAILAAMLPAPRRWTPSKRPAALYHRSRIVVERLEELGELTHVQATVALADLDARLGTKKKGPAVEPPHADEIPDDDEAEPAPEPEKARPEPEPAPPTKAIEAPPPPTEAPDAAPAVEEPRIAPPAPAP